MTPRAGTMWLLFFTPTIERDEEMKLLIIDDEEGIRSSLKSLFRSEGYTLLEADDGLSGERLLREERPEVTITDIRLPGKSGLDLLETVRKEALPTETIIITGYGNVDLAVQATRAGAFDFIEKPFSPDRILLTVRNAFEKAALSQARRGTLEAELAGALIVGESSPVQALKEKIRQVAPSDATVLILGESGSGKELVAKNLHLLSRRSLQPYVHLNCAAIPEELLESELFGHRKGSFTGAIENKKGKFEEAQGGTLFLDEIGDLSLRAQAKVLRIIENGEVQRIGETEVKRVDVRTVAATNKKLVEEIGRGSFREDLFFRLNVVTLEVPPLRERRDDIPLLMDHFSRRIASETGQKPKEVSPERVSLRRRPVTPLSSPSTSSTTLFQRTVILGFPSARSAMTFEARKASRRWTIVTVRQSRERKRASSMAVSPPPTTATSWLRKKAPSQVAQAETPRPRNARSDGMPR